MSRFARHVEREYVGRDGIDYPLRVVALHDYCNTVEIVRSFVPPGSPTNDETIMLAEHGQAIIRRVLLVLRDLFSTNRCFSVIDANTFCVDLDTGIPMVRMHALAFIIKSDVAGIANNMRMMAQVFRANVMAAGLRVPDEVDQGLLQMMENEGYTMQLCIYNHSSLVPVHNRMDLQFRLFQRLTDLVAKLRPAAYRLVLSLIDFPADWHARVQANMFMEQMYRGSNYNQNKQGIEQAMEVLRYGRNGGGAHGLQYATDTLLEGTGIELFGRTDLAEMFYEHLPMLLHSFQRAMHIIGELDSIGIEYLFVYLVHEE